MKIFNTTETTRMQTIFLVLKYPKNMHTKFLSISGIVAVKRHDFTSNQDNLFAHWSGMTVSTRDRLHNSSFFQIKTPTITLTLHCSSTMVEDMKKNWFQLNIYIFINISISGVCRLGHCTTFAKWWGWYTMCWDNWGTKKTIYSVSGRTSWVQSCLI